MGGGELKNSSQSCALPKMHSDKISGFNYFRGYFVSVLVLFVFL